jgi:phage terminase large subunit-like protein
MGVEIPKWLIEKYGRPRAQDLYRILIDRWNLVSFNSENQHPGQIRLLDRCWHGDTHTNYAICGNRWGKSHCGAAIVVSLVTGIKPWCIGGTGFEDLYEPPKRMDVWISSLDFPASRDIIRPKLEHFLPKNLVSEWRQADQMYVLKNGSILGLKSAESGWQKYQGTSRSIIWLDEEHPIDVYRECEARVVDTDGMIVGTMTPVNGFSWTYDEIWLKQDEDPDIFVVTGEMDDNPYLSKDAIERRTSKWDETTEKARRKGLFTLIRGSQVFDIESLTQYMEECCDPMRVDRAAGVRIWEEPDPDVEYVIGADTAKGKAKGDFSVGVVLDAHHRNIVAVLRGRMDAETFGRRLDELGRHYNNALINPERNDHGIVTIRTLSQLSYPRIWRKRTVGRIAPDVRLELGFSTDAVGKPLLVSLLQQAMDGMSVGIPDRVIVDELASFIWYDDKLPQNKDSHKTVGRCGAMSGRHDDCVIALALALVGIEGIGRTKKVRVEAMSPTQKQAYNWKRSRQRGAPAIVGERKYFKLEAS